MRGLVGSSKRLLLLLNKLDPLLLFLLTRLDGETNHFLFFLGSTVGVFLRCLRHFDGQSHLLIHVIATSCHWPCHVLSER